MQSTIYLATNRDPKGRPPRSFGATFNSSHPHELRYGEFSIDTSFRGPRTPGTELAEHLTEQIEEGEGKLTVYEEQLARPPFTFGSSELFKRLRAAMCAGTDTLVYVHGFNVSLAAALGSALALQHKLRQHRLDVNVVLFTWPSDGSVRKYLSDRDDATTSGLAFSRAFQRLKDFLDTITREERCGRQINLLCHSMGNFVLENTLWHLRRNVGMLPRAFSEIVLAAPDVDSDALHEEHKLGRLHQLGRRVSVYYNREDVALTTSDKVKGNPDRLGQTGPKRPLDVPTGVVNVDCTEIVGGVMEHSYYLSEALPDVATTLAGTPEDRFGPRRHYVSSANAYRLVRAGR